MSLWRNIATNFVSEELYDCKRSCKADLQAYGRKAKRGCKDACKTSNPPASGQAWLDSQAEEAHTTSLWRDIATSVFVSEELYDCKRSCEADLQAYGGKAKRGCKDACKTSNPPASGQAWLDSQAEEARIIFTGDAMTIETNAALGQAAASSGNTTWVVLGIIALAVGAIILLRK